jgi:2-oxoglutarate ferredoxin oxidoreductase subunit alpha
MIQDISIAIAGRAGDGVLFTGNILAKMLKRHGWDIVTTRDFPSNIRGESTNYTIRAALKKIYGRADQVDILLAFDCDAIVMNMPKLAKRGIVFCDGEGLEKVQASQPRGRTFHEFPLKKLAREKFGKEIFKNMLALGALSYVLDLDLRVIEEIISDTFLERKGREIVQKNVQALALGFEKAKEMITERECHPLAKREDRDRLILSGDEAIALGALAGGCRFFAAYPICPASEIWQWLGYYIHEFDGLVVQTEDELAALNMALGASYAGARAMTSTSGPGASLMMEAFSLSGMAEIPVVVAHVQRLGPSTGIPTKSEQGDLTQWIYGSHGDFPRIILSPGTIEECFEFTVEAFNLAEKYQCPVIVLTEQDLGQNLRTARTFDLTRLKIDRGKLLSQDALLGIQGFKRYQDTRDGVSPRSIPSSKNGLHMVEGNEHDEKGYRDENPGTRVRMMEKRMRKLRTASRDSLPPKLRGDKKAPCGLIGCGSTLGPILEAQRQLEADGITTKFLQLRTLWPFPIKPVKAFINSCRNVFVVENNYSGQLSSLIKSQVSPCLNLQGVRKYATLPFQPQEIASQIKKGL